MKQPLDTRQLNAFVDGELDLRSQLEIEDLLRHDSPLRAQVEELRQLRQAVRANADYHLAPASLRSRVAALAAAQAGVPDTESPLEPTLRPKRGASDRGQRSRWSGALSGLSSWVGWRPAMASLATATLMVLVLNLTGVLQGQDERVMGDVLASHVRSTVGQHLVDVASSDHHTVKPWLSSRLGFSPPVSELRLPGATFLGGRVDVINGRPVAALAYRYGEHVVNSFLWPADAKDSAPKFFTEKGFNVARWSRGGMSHWVVADVNAEEFGIIVRTLAAGDGAR
jgi:anti-sigma factor RsiW